MNEPKIYEYESPTSLTREHDLTNFNCGESEINDWLKQRAFKSQEDGAARTYVICLPGTKTVIAYYCLAVGSVINNKEEIPGKIRRNMPQSIPVMVLGRLGVDLQHTGKGIAQGLVRDAILRTLQAAQIAGIRAILVHALNEKVKDFYVKKCGFMSSAVKPLTLMMSLVDAQKSLKKI
jgi:GNAT superfamily N-acetyltransferase